ncbi:MAG: flavodoxin [Clostridiaceae bacterium BRH_c20a]|nr:MAG: flavodoxin [Clostridiaceae bacterium BRH_c20a]
MSTLIVYSTKYGCAQKCAQMLSEKLNGKVDLCNLKTSKALDPAAYDKVVIGGSIYIGKVQKEVSRFCSDNRSILKDKTIGLFICGMFKDQAEKELKDSFPLEILNNAVAKEFLGGEFVFKKMNPVERLMVKRIAKVDKDLTDISEENINRIVQSMNNI